MSEDNAVDSFVSTLESLSDLAKENEEMINQVATSVESLSGGSPVFGEDEYESRAGQDDPITELHVTEDMLMLDAEADYITPSEVKIGFEGGKLHVIFENRHIEVNDAPDDVIIDEAEVFVNNGVLELQVPRGKSVETSITESEEEL
jgi:HSP20 family molecular chaperone IbpA